MYWTSTLIFGQSTSFIACFLYNRAHENDSLAIDSSFLWTFLVVLEANFVLFFMSFILAINRGYISTFFTTMTGTQYACRCYHEATNDLAKSNIIYKHRSYYESINEELKEWLASNWERWVDEKPDWFTPFFYSRIPKDLLPPDHKSSLRMETGDDSSDPRSSVRRLSAQLEQGLQGMSLSSNSDDTIAHTERSEAGRRSLRESIRRLSVQLESAGEEETLSEAAKNKH